MLKTISLYTGIGGLDFGFEAAGFETALAVEMDPVACQTLKVNRNWPVVCRDLASISSDEILATAGLRPGEPDVLIGGPPCQPFSKSSYWAGPHNRGLDDERSGALGGFLRVLRDIKPKVFLLENVRGLADNGKGHGLRHLVQGIEQVNREAGTGYSVSAATLNTADYGVPQKRERVFVVGARQGGEFVFPAATHGPRSRESEWLFDLEAHRTAWDAIGDLPRQGGDEALRVGGKWGALLPTIPEGHNYLWHTERGGGRPIFGWRRRYWSFLLKLSKRLPSWTIQAQPGPATGPFHWDNRRLTVRELCRLQTLPDEIVFECGRAKAQQMIGNAVPALMAEVLAGEIRVQFLDGRRLATGVTLRPPARKDVPPEEPIAPVPRSFEEFVGDHAAHPGEGRGARAWSRAGS